MRWLDRLLRRTTDDAPPLNIRDPFVPKRYVTDDERAYLSDKLAAVEKNTELLARLQRLGYEFDTATRRDKNDVQQ